MVKLTKAEFDDLLDRLKRATQSTHELDLDVLWATFPDERAFTRDGVRYISTMTKADGEHVYGPLADRDDCAHFTAGVDALLALLPGHCGVALFYNSNLTSDPEDDPIGGRVLHDPDGLPLACITDRDWLQGGSARTFLCEGEMLSGALAGAILLWHCPDYIDITDVL